jgi:hypothetical protein
VEFVTVFRLTNVFVATVTSVRRVALAARYSTFNLISSYSGFAFIVMSSYFIPSVFVTSFPFMIAGSPSAPVTLIFKAKNSF